VSLLGLDEEVAVSFVVLPLFGRQVTLEQCLGSRLGFLGLLGLLLALGLCLCPSLGVNPLDVVVGDASATGCAIVVGLGAPVAVVELNPVGRCRDAPVGRVDDLSRSRDP
jgi:hypothetical protein